jgi:pSer/pThr/pTyr-binding forkhead associated (FHA) protein
MGPVAAVAMKRVLLLYQGDSIELTPGETVVGRAIECGIRFNDPAVSREHARLTFDDNGVCLDDLGSSNGTLINGRPARGRMPLKDEDVIQLGRRTLKVSILEDASRQESSAMVTSPHRVVSVAAAEGEGRPQLNCVACRAKIPADADECPNCGEPTAPNRPHARTRNITPGQLWTERRVGRRYSADTPLFYVSETLAFDAVACDLSLSGVFVATELLDEVGARCKIVVLPDGSPPVHVAGAVRRVVEEEGRTGMGVEFTALTEEAERWLVAYIERASTAP